MLTNVMRKYYTDTDNNFLGVFLPKMYQQICILYFTKTDVLSTDPYNFFVDIWVNKSSVFRCSGGHVDSYKSMNTF